MAKASRFASAKAGSKVAPSNEVAHAGKAKPANPKPPTKLPKGPRKGELAAADKVGTDTAKYEALAREHGADLSEEGFNEALRKVGRAKSEPPSR